MDIESARQLHQVVDLIIKPLDEMRTLLENGIKNDTLDDPAWNARLEECSALGLMEFDLQSSVTVTEEDGRITANFDTNTREQ